MPADQRRKWEKPRETDGCRWLIVVTQTVILVYKKNKQTNNTTSQSKTQKQNCRYFSHGVVEMASSLFRDDTNFLDVLIIITLHGGNLYQSEYVRVSWYSKPSPWVCLSGCVCMIASYRWGASWLTAPSDCQLRCVVNLFVITFIIQPTDEQTRTPKPQLTHIPEYSVTHIHSHALKDTP